MYTTVVIPNYNGIAYIKACVDSLRAEIAGHPAHIIIVDNASTDGSREWIKEHVPEAELIALKKNTGFSKAVNLGIKRAKTPYVLLLNNDTVVKQDFIKNLELAMGKHPKAFSISACMLDMKDENLIDSAGDYYCALGWAFARGKGKEKEKYEKPCEIFSSCGGAALYRREVFEQIGYFDEAHFAYLEDVDIGWRARIFGYHNYYEPTAQVLHAGSAVSGSRYNAFKVKLSSANSTYIIGKNMPLLQLVINFPLLLAGFAVKTVFFVKKGFGKLYVQGLFKGIARCFSEKGRAKKVPFRMERLPRYICLEGELLRNILYRFLK